MFWNRFYEWWLEGPSSSLTCIFPRVLIKLSSLTALPGSLKIRYRVLLKYDKVGLIFFSSTKLLWCVFGNVSEKNIHARGAFSCIMEQPISARFGSYFARSRFLLSHPFPPPPILCSNCQNKIWGRDQERTQILRMCTLFSFKSGIF